MNDMPLVVVTIIIVIGNMAQTHNLLVDNDHNLLFYRLIFDYVFLKVGEIFLLGFFHL